MRSNEDPMQPKIFKKLKIKKEPIWPTAILAGRIYIIRPSLSNLNLFCKQISLNLAIFDRNEGDFREKNYVSIETIIHTCGY